MLDHAFPDLESWVLYFRDRELPVLQRTIRRLDEARENLHKVSPRDITQILLQDPLMAARVLAYIQPFHGKRLGHEITTVAGAVVMLGIEPFFARFSNLTSLESVLHATPTFQLGAIQVIRRAQRAAHFAQEWATWRLDINIEEVTLAALLHDLSEMLLWCFAPSMALDIQRLQKADASMRSHRAQEAVLGIRLHDLQIQLCQAWGLPDLLSTLMTGADAESPRVQNVQLAVDLARHSAHGWDDAGLPDDYVAIGQLLNLNPAAVKERLGLDPITGQPVADPLQRA